jgi:menaquinol-cytochrome c reductase iron-sulfur subunit
MNESDDSNPHSRHRPTPGEITRRRFLGRLSVALGGVCAALLGVPVIGFVTAPLFRRMKDTWISVGRTDEFEIGSTVNVPFPDPSPLPWAGITAKGAAWLRRESNGQFSAFSVNCTHMGCPVRWLPDADLFMCPCHGGVYYEDGTVAAGPPPKPLVRFDVRVANGRVEIKAAAIPITTKL